MALNCSEQSDHEKPRQSLITDEEIRAEFSHHDADVARINNGSFGSCPATIFAAQRQWQLRWLRQPDHFYFYHLQPSILKTRQIIKDLVNAANVDEITIIENVTTATAIILQQVGLAFYEGKYNKGDYIIMLNHTYGAVKKSVQAYVTRAGGRVLEASLPFPVKSNEEIVSEFRKTLLMGKSDGHRVRLAVIDHITSMPSIVVPIKELVKICRDEGVDQIFVDGAHAIGSISIDMNEIGADFYTSNLHKWLFCPPSVAFLYCRKSDKSLNIHHPIVSSEYGKGLPIESGWIGTRDYSAQLVVPQVIEFFDRFEGGIEGVMERNNEKVIEMGGMLAKTWGTHLGSPPGMCSSMLMVGLPASLKISSNSDCLNLRTHLRECFGIEVHIFFRAPKDGEINPITGYARISHQVYNTLDDYVRFRDAVNKLVNNGFTCSNLVDFEDEVDKLVDEGFACSLVLE